MIANKREMKKIGTWLIDGETGASSQAMAAVALGGSPSIVRHPLDPSDLHRCVEFLEECIDPSRHHDLLFLMSQFTKPWGRIRAHWYELMTLYRVECKQKTAPQLYELMKALKL